MIDLLLFSAVERGNGIKVKNEGGKKEVVGKFCLAGHDGVFGRIIF